MTRITRALLSVTDRSDLAEFAQGLHELGVELLSTGGTAEHLAAAGLPVTQVSDFTGFPEILGGRVKTLHPKVHGGLLGIVEDPTHQEEMNQNNILPIDLLVVNLYAFEATIAKPGCTFDGAIEKIDIGGPAMIRSAAKNHSRVTVVVNPVDYHAVLYEMRRNNGCVNEAMKRSLALEAFRLTAKYDAAIALYLERDAQQRLLRGE